MNWKNVNLKSGYERAQNILEPYDFETLLLEVACNIKDISPETVKEQAMNELHARYNESISILNDNLDNITNYAIKERAIQ